MLEQTSRVSSPQQNKENLPISTCPQTFTFRIAAQHHVELNPADFYLWGYLKTFVHSALIANKETFQQRIFEA
jgi:hypothetical protein